MPTAPKPNRILAHKTTLAAALLLGFAVSSASMAEVSTTTDAAAVEAPATARLEIDKSYALGIAKFELDHETKVTGWQVSDRWFFGRQRGLDSGLTLVWQQQSNQVSVSRDGVRFTRRF